MLEGIRSVILKRQGFTDNYEVFKVVNNNGFYMYINEGIAKRVDNKLMLYFFDNFFRVISDWKHEYINNYGVDLENWSLRIEYGDGNIKEYHGKGMYPDNFNVLESLIYEMIDKSLGVQQ